MFHYHQCPALAESLLPLTCGIIFLQCEEPAQWMKLHICRVIKKFANSCAFRGNSHHTCPTAVALG